MSTRRAPPFHPKPKTTPPKGIAYTPQERNRAIWEMIAVASEMLRHGEEPRAIGTAMTAAVHKVMQESRGSVRAAATALKLASSTFLSQRDLGLADVCHYLAMHDPLDDKLFPFIRVQWQSSNLAFLEEYFTWLGTYLQPRAHQEQTKLVLLQNYSPFSGPVSNEYVDALTSGVQSHGDMSVVRGIVIFAPSMPDLATKLGVVNAGNELDQSGLVRFTTTSEMALGHAVQMFAEAGLTSIPPLHLD